MFKMKSNGRVNVVYFDLKSNKNQADPGPNMQLIKQKSRRKVSPGGFEFFYRF